MNVRGFTVVEAIVSVAIVMAAYSITTAACELPTGGVADVVGRRPVLIAASALFVVQPLSVARVAGVM